MSSPICIYFQKGHCKNGAYCQYKHIRRDCSYWVQGYCKKGDSCNFEHSISPDPMSPIRVQTTVHIPSPCPSPSPSPSVKVQTRVAIKTIPIMWGINNQPLTFPSPPPPTPSPVSVTPPIVAEIRKPLVAPPKIRVASEIPSDSPHTCHNCKDGKVLENCIIPRCDVCPSSTQCNCDIRRLLCQCTDCNRLYTVPTCKSCEIFPVIVGSGWKYCGLCMFEKHKTDFLMSGHASAAHKDKIRLANIAAVTAKCYTCMDGRNLKSCIAPKIVLENGEESQTTDIKMCSSKVQCYRCRELYNTPLCTVCCRLGEPYSGYLFCNECSFFDNKQKTLRYTDPHESKMKILRQNVFFHGPMFKPGFTYTGIHTTNSCGMCYNGLYKPAMIRLCSQNGDKVKCLFCNLILNV